MYQLPNKRGKQKFVADEYRIAIQNDAIGICHAATFETNGLFSPKKSYNFTTDTVESDCQNIQSPCIGIY